MNAWIYLILAGLFEVGWAISLKLSYGFSKLIPSILFIVFLISSMILLSFAVEEIPIGTAYAFWTAIGAIGVAIIGIVFLGENASFLRILGIILIVLGIISLNLSPG